MEKPADKKGTPPKGQNIKLKQKSEVFSDVTHVSKRSYQFQAATMVKHLNLDIFKITPCNITKSHNYKHCVNYHNSKDRKRYGNYYHTETCPFAKQDQKCPEGDACLYAHSFVQEHYNYQKYKKQFCSHFPHSIHECPYGDYCSYAHSQEQILVTLIHNYIEDDDFYMFHYKTQWCPFNLTEHNMSKCVYAHNLQDYRRKPNVYLYEPIPCINWRTQDFILDYNSGCQNSFNCNMCHGWKEQQYHPAYYKTVQCKVNNCKKGQCPGYHSQKEKRNVESGVLSHAFCYVPKNRMVEGIFKSNANKEGFKLKPNHKAKTVVHQKVLKEQNDSKTKTLIAVKEKPRTSAEKIQNQWIKDKKIINSEEESEEEESEVVTAQVEALKLHM